MRAGGGEGEQHQRGRRGSALHKEGEGARTVDASEYRADPHHGDRCPRAAVLFNEAGEGTHAPRGA